MRWLCLAVAALAVLSSAAYSEQRAAVTSARTIKNDVALTICLPRNQLAGHAIELKITLANRSKRKVTYYYVTKFRDFRIRINDDKNKPVPLTAFGQKRIGGEWDERFLYSKRTLGLGDSYSVTLNVARLFDLTLAGTYKLSVLRPLNEHTKDEFAIQIKDHRLVVSEPLHDAEVSSSNETTAAAANPAQTGPSDRNTSRRESRGQDTQLQEGIGIDEGAQPTTLAVPPRPPSPKRREGK